MTVDLEFWIHTVDHIDEMTEILACGTVERAHVVPARRLGEFRNWPIGRGSPLPGAWNPVIPGLSSMVTP